MSSEQQYNETINKIVTLEDKFIEIKAITKILNIWVKEKDYELIPIINMLNNKIDDVVKVFEK